MSVAALTCMALNIYFEARDQPVSGQVAVAAVVMARVRSPRYPDDVCEVVYQKRGNKCQFSWYCDGKSDRPRDEDAYLRATLIAQGALAGSTDHRLHAATHYHTAEILPYWAKEFPAAITVGDHIFYEGW